MKKIIITILGVAIFCMLIGYTSALAIPDEALRIRVIANSNSTYDQEIKKAVDENNHWRSDVCSGDHSEPYVTGIRRLLH